MTLSNIYEIINDSDRFRNILRQNKQTPTNSEILGGQDLLLECKQKNNTYICDLLQDFRNDSYSICDLLDILKGENIMTSEQYRTYQRVCKNGIRYCCDIIPNGKLHI